MTQSGSPFVILIIAPRPPATRDTLTYATLEGLYQGIEAQGPLVRAEHLRPATPAALAARLGAAQQPRVDMVIVDGALDGQSAEVLFEGEGQAQGVGADALGSLLAEAGVSLALLRVQSGAAEAPSLAEALAAQSGAPALWVRPDLSGKLAHTLMSELLAQLLAGEPLGVSVESAAALVGQATRRAADATPALRLYGRSDARWTSPAGGQASGISQVAPLARHTLGGALERLPGPGEPGSLPAEPPLGLVGRSREMVELESLLAPEKAAPVWIYGYDGLGKTALVGQTARWLVRTGRFERVVYSSLGRSGMASVALYDLGRRLLDSAPAGDDAVDAIIASLQERPTLVIWDDFQAVLPGGELMTGPVEVGEWYRLANRLAAASPSRLCILTDGAALPESARRLQGARSLELSLLGEEDAAQLLARLCRWLGAPPPQPETLHTLVSALGGHPLTLRLMAARLVGAAPDKAAARLLSDLPGLATGEARFRNEALEILFDRLLQALPEALRLCIPSLGLFMGGFPQHIGLGIMGLDPAIWEEHETALAQAGLAGQEAVADLSTPYIQMHPALKRLARQRLDSRARQQLGATFSGHYLAFLGWLLRMRERAPQSVAALTYHDIGNMGRALDLILEDQDLVLAINYGRLYTQLLEALGLADEARHATERVQEATTKAVPREGPLGRPGVQLLWSQADRMIEAGQLAPASALLRQLVERMNVQGGLNYIGMEADLDRARTLCRLGRAMRLGRRYDLALVPLQRGIEALNDLGREPAARRERAELYAELAETLIATGQYQEAEQQCQAGLREITSLSDPATEGGLHARMGVIAVRRNQAEQAREHYARALEQMRRAQDAPGMAAIETQLASLAMRPPADLDRAREHLARALGHAHDSENALLEGQIVVQLAQVAAQSGDGAEAERLFRQALALYAEHDITPGLIASRASLAELLLQQGRAEDARAEAEAALETAESAGPDMVPWELYLLLQRIAQERGQAEELARWRAATQTAFARSPQAGPIRMRWQSVINAVAQGARGETMDAEVAQTIEEMETVADWRNLGRAIMRILSGERGDALWRDLDHMDAVIVRAILEALAEQPEQDAPPS